MAEQRIKRRLAAILAADVVGYSRLVGIDEEGTLAALKSLRKSLIDLKISEHRGRVVKNTGDGALVEFASAVDAVQCAMETQRDMADRTTNVPEDRRSELRIGINIGDIVIEEGDIFGDGVNIAVRLESIAAPGGVCISEDVYRQVRGKFDSTFEDIGEQKLKNIVRPVRAYRMRIVGSSAGASTGEHAAKLPLPDKPSIAVLAFQNMSGDVKQEYFADGIAEDIITALSKSRWLFVIARNSSFTYKGRSVDVKQIGRELGVRYVLEGSVRKSGNRMRITAQLIEAATGAHMWADKFDGVMSDIFDLQDQVTTSVVGAIAPALEHAEIDRSTKKPTESLDAYDYYMRGIACVQKWSREANNEATRLFTKATEIDPNYAAAYALAAWCYGQRRVSGWVSNRLKETFEAERLSRRACEIGHDDAVALAFGGQTLAHVVGDVEGGKIILDRAIMLNPNLAWGWFFSGWIRAVLGEPEKAIEHIAKAIRLSPVDPWLFGLENTIALAHIIAGNYDEALVWAEKAFQRKPHFPPATRNIVVAHALSGNLEEAKRAATRLLELDPALRVTNFRESLSFRRPQDLAKFEEGLRLAGVPE